MRNKASSTKKATGKARLELYNDTIRREILQVVDALTPPLCKVCTTREVMVALSQRGYELLNLQKIAGHLRALKRMHFIEASASGKLHLWSITQAGRKWTREHPPKERHLES